MPQPEHPEHDLDGGHDLDERTNARAHARVRACVRACERRVQACRRARARACVHARPNLRGHEFLHARACNAYLRTQLHSSPSKTPRRPSPGPVQLCMDMCAPLCRAYAHHGLNELGAVSAAWWGTQQVARLEFATAVTREETANLVPRGAVL